MKEKRSKKINQKEEDRLDKPFEIASLCRRDLMDDMIEYSKSRALRITDAQMESLARKLGEDYTAQLFWASLSILVELHLEYKNRW